MRKEIYYWIIIGLLLVGFICMSLILVQGLMYVRKIARGFIEFIKELLP